VSRFPTSPASRGSQAVKSAIDGGGAFAARPKENGMSVQDKIREQVTGHPVVLYMKGSPQFPQCGFSATATEILKRCGAEQVFTVDVLQNQDIREGIKQYANWPTIPQLYVNGEFVGGCDIMKEMYQSGELQKVLAEAKKPA
jgi:monothiol glutaredoxin